MQLQYLGTAAAEGVPGMFCECPICQNAREVGGREVRTRSQAIVDGRLLIDFPADTFCHITREGIRLQGITSLLVTHAHSDHFYPKDFENRSPGYAHLPDGLPRLQLYGSKTVAEAYYAVAHPSWQVDVHVLEAYNTVDIDGYRVTPYPANHDPGAGPFVYAIQSNDACLFYCNDSGVPCDAVFEHIAGQGLRFDAVSLDCTGILQPWRDGHMGLPANREVVERLTAIGAVDEHTKIIVNHFSHNGGLTYAQLVEQLSGNANWHVSYDGMTVDF